MSRTRVRVASLTAIAYAALLLVGTLVHFAGGGEGARLSLSFARPMTWLVAIVAIVVGVGLWQRYAWAWWLGLVAAVVQLYRVGSPVVTHFSFSRPPGWNTIVVLLLLVVFLVLLLSAKARASCNR